MGTDVLTKNETKPPGKDKNIVNKEDELSAEDQQLKDELLMLLDQLEEPKPELYKHALENICALIKSATTSMTSVPKPLKFLSPHYSRINEIYQKIIDPNVKAMCAEVISVLGMTVSDKEEHLYDTLSYRLLGSKSEIGAWGHEYVRHLTMQIVSYWDNFSIETDTEVQPKITLENCIDLVNLIIPYLMEHNAESEAIDLCVEVNKLDLLELYTSKSNYERVCLYMTSCVPYLLAPENTNVLECSTTLYKKFGDLGGAMRCALRQNSPTRVKELFTFAMKDSTPSGLAVQRQLAYLLSKHGVILNDDDEADYQDLTEMLWNSLLSEHFLVLATELDIKEPKIPEDIYKSHLEPVRSMASGAMDTTRSNLASAFVNGFVNAGFGKEKMIQDTTDVSLLVKQKDYAKMCTVATLGWVNLWDVDNGLSNIEKYLESKDQYIHAGGLLGCGVVNCGVKHECDPAQALLSQYVDSDDELPARAAIIGLGVAYSGSSKADLVSLLTPIILDEKPGRFYRASLAALSAGLVCVGAMNSDLIAAIIQTLLTRNPKQIKLIEGKYMALGLALTCMGRQEDAEVVLASLEAVPEPMKSVAHMMCDFCAYAGSGNVLKIQNLLHILSEKYEKTPKGSTDGTGSKASGSNKTSSKDGSGRRKQKQQPTGSASATPSKPTAETGPEPMEIGGGSKDDQTKKTDSAGAAAAAGSEEDGEAGAAKWDFRAHQGLAAIGVAVLAMGDEVGMDMAFRMFGNLLRFGELPIKRAVPLALALCYVSNPQLKVLDTLSKFSHDADADVSYNSIFAMGLVGSGTNNARLAAMLRHLAVFHARDPQNLFLVRLAQGLTHLGKGTMTLSPWHSDRFLVRNVSLASLLIMTVASIDNQHSFMGRQDYLLFYLTPAIQPRLLMTFDEDHKPLAVTVRVGQAVDVVGQAGKPKTITGFQTHTTPVLLSAGERAELATDEYLTVTQSPLEGFVLLKKNPDHE